MRDRFLHKIHLAVLSGCVWASIVVPLTAAEKPSPKPNILFIMVDDLGKDWISCYGAQDITTPNIDALANGGMMFHNAYSMPSCTPSRATLLTGKYPWRNGYVNHWDVPRWGVAYFDWEKEGKHHLCSSDERSWLRHLRGRQVADQ